MLTYMQHSLIGVNRVMIGDSPVLCVTARSLFVFVCYSGYKGFVISMHNKSISYNGLEESTTI